MYTLILGIHNLIRWVVLGAGAFTVWHVWRSWMRRAPWSDTDARAGKIFVIALTAQFTVGVLLYLVSPMIGQGYRDFGKAMGDPSVRYFMVDHAVAMIAAIAVAHVGAARVRRATSDSAKFQTATIWYGIALAAVAGFVPWGRPLLPSF